MKTILFDLSDTLIRGLRGVEYAIAPLVNSTPAGVLSALYGGENTRGLNFDTALYRLNLGDISEDDYLANVVFRNNWNIHPDILKRLIRDNFTNRVDGFTDYHLEKLYQAYSLVLVSDHAREWCEFVLSTHSFLDIFSRKFFSFEMNQTKHSFKFFERVLDDLGVAASDCVLVDDAQRNLDTAAIAGIPGILFTGIETLVVLPHDQLTFA